MMTILNSKIKKSVPKPSLMKASNRHKNKDIIMGEASLLID